MKLKDRAVTCIHCGAWEEVGTDWMHPKRGLVVLASKPCNCASRVELPASKTCGDCGKPMNGRRLSLCADCSDRHAAEQQLRANMSAKCIDCGEPCRKQRCLSCSNRANSYGRKPLPKCPCGAQLKHPQAKFCSGCRTEKNRVDNRERGQRRREAA